MSAARDAGLSVGREPGCEPGVALGAASPAGWCRVGPACPETHTEVSPCWTPGAAPKAAEPGGGRAKVHGVLAQVITGEESSRDA